MWKVKLKNKTKKMNLLSARFNCNLKNKFETEINKHI